ncbi:copper resistance CopC/CopD family protein, partial [Actinacidiphila acidipaludis]
ALASPAAAHADLVGSSPRGGSVLGAEPAQVTLAFSERVTLALSTVTVIGPSGRRADRGASAEPGSGGERIRVGVAPEADHGTFVVSWRVTAADDGHTTSGVFTFAVGAPSGTSAAEGTTAARNRPTDAVLDLAIWLGFAGLAGLAGVAVLRFSAPDDPNAATDQTLDAAVGAPSHGLTQAAPDGDGRNAPEARDTPGEQREAMTALAAAVAATDAPTTTAPAWTRMRRPAALGWALLLTGTVLQLLAYGPASQGASLRHAVDRPLLSASLSGHLGHALVARIMLLALIAAIGEEILRHRRAGAATAAVLTLLLALTWSETSHAPSGSLVPLALAVTTLHVTAMAVWAGGVACLLVLMIRRPEAAGVAVVARRFSRVALAAVVVLAATGLWQACREVGSVDALTGTHYGRLLLVKVALVLAVLAAAAHSRTRVGRRRGAPAAVSGVRGSLLVELAGITAVLVVTVLLIGTAPARVPHGGGTVTDQAPAASVRR